MPRLFVAVDPGEQVLARLALVIEKLRRKAPDAKWVRTDAMHLTLVFLGAIEDAALPAIMTALHTVAGRHGSLVLTVHGGGVFGAPRRPRVLWAGISGELERLRALQQDVEAAVVPFGLTPEDRAYSPHLTLARARESRGEPALSACAQALAAEPFGEATIGEVVLYQSDLSPAGARYTALCRAPLLGKTPER
jgi:RNA 2',3'-cyclic 3'-phosphodiesterase